MSRLLLNITHETTGQLNLGIQTDCADQQVALLQHQLGDAMRKADEPAAQDPRVAELETIVENQRHEINSLRDRFTDAVNTANQALAEARKAKRPARKKAPARTRR